VTRHFRSDARALRGRPDVFLSAKTLSAIPARHPLVRQGLVQASLDPAVRSISHVATAAVGPAQVEVDAVVLARDDGRLHLDVVEARRVRDIEDEGVPLQIALRDLGLAPLVLTADDLKAEPRCSNVNLVWSYNGRAVTLDLRLRVLQILIDDGPLQLGHLLERIPGRDPIAAVMSLACSDLLEIDLMSQPVGPATTVRSRT
jgi:hypothetical protein